MTTKKVTLTKLVLTEEEHEMLTNVAYWIETLGSETFDKMPEKVQNALNEIFGGIEVILKTEKEGC